MCPFSIAEVIIEKALIYIFSDLIFSCRIDCKPKDKVL